jgi:hypothetical protein
MNTTLITAMVGVLGSFVGASAAVATAWVSQRTLNRRELFRDSIRKREALYDEFIGECARLAVDALSHSLEKPEVLLPAYALLNRIRLCASPAVLAEAENVLRRITEQYFAGNLQVDQIRQIALSREGDPLEDFGRACRAELKSMQKQA